MLALEQLHTQPQSQALFFVLIGAALAMLSLRAAVSLCQRARVARDREIITALERARHRRAQSVVSLG